MLLTSWVGHNKQHSEKLRKWTEKVENPEGDPTYNSALKAVEELKKANERLSQALIELEGGK